MRLSPIKTKLFLPFLVLAYVFVLNFGITSMTMNEGGTMSDCPFMVGTSICPMGVFEHIAAFQNIFGIIFSKTISNIFILLISFSAIFFLVLESSSPPKLLFLLKTSLERFFPKKLLLALSDGTLQPKLYA